MKVFGLTVLAIVFAAAAFAQDGANDPQANPMQGNAGTETTAPSQQQDQAGAQNQQQVAPDQGQGQGAQGAQGSQNQNNPQDTTATTY